MRKSMWRGSFSWLNSPGGFVFLRRLILIQMFTEWECYQVSGLLLLVFCGIWHFGSSPHVDFEDLQFLCWWVCTWGYEMESGHWFCYFEINWLPVLGFMVGDGGGTLELFFLILQLCYFVTSPHPLIWLLHGYSNPTVGSPTHVMILYVTLYI